jgi:hypothetical protein
VPYAVRFEAINILEGDRDIDDFFGDEEEHDWAVGGAYRRGFG